MDIVLGCADCVGSSRFIYKADVPEPLGERVASVWINASLLLEQFIDVIGGVATNPQGSFDINMMILLFKRRFYAKKMMILSGVPLDGAVAECAVHLDSVRFSLPQLYASVRLRTGDFVTRFRTGCDFIV